MWPAFRATSRFADRLLLAKLISLYSQPKQREGEFISGYRAQRNSASNLNSHCNVVQCSYIYMFLPHFNATLLNSQLVQRIQERHYNTRRGKQLRKPSGLRALHLFYNPRPCDNNIFSSYASKIHHALQSNSHSLWPVRLG